MTQEAPFASVAELEAFWRVLTPAEKSRANVLLPMASDRLRVMANKVGINLDEKAAEYPFKSTVQWVVMESVKRAISTPTDTPPVNQFSQTAGPYSQNLTFTNPSGDLWFKKSELQALGLYGMQSLSSISTSRTDIYGS